MLLPEHIELLKENPLFYSIETRKYEVLLETFNYRLEHFQSGEEITRDFDDIGILVSGAVRILKQSIDNAETVVERVELGGVFGEVLTCLHTNGSPYKVIAETDSAVILIPYNNLLAPTEYQDHFTVLSNFMRLLSRRNLLVERKLEVLSKRTLADKILTFLAIQREVTGSDTFIIPYSRQQLSEYLCVDRSALSRELSNLKQVGLIKYKKNLFTIMTSYEDFDDEDNSDVDDEDEFVDSGEAISSLVPNFEIDDFDNIKEIPRPSAVDPIEDELEDILNGDININDINITKIEIDDEEIDNISIDDILNDNIQITTKSSSEEKPKTTPIFEDDDDFFTQEFAKLNDDDIDDLSTADVLNEMIQDGVIEDVSSSNPNYFDNTPPKIANVYDDINYYDEYETGEESAMSEALREEQSKVFSQFVTKAKEIANKNITQEHHHGQSVEAFADRLGEELLPKNKKPQYQPIQEEQSPEQLYNETEETVAPSEPASENIVEEDFFEEISIESYEKFTPPVSQTVAQDEEYAPPTEEFAPPTEEYATSTEEYATQTEEYATSTEEYATPTEEYATSIEEYATFEQTLEQNLPPTEEYVAPTEQVYYDEVAPPQVGEVSPHEVSPPEETPPVEELHFNEQETHTLSDEPVAFEEVVEEEVDERDVNLLLEPTETLVEKIAEEFAPKSIQEAVEKLKEEILPNFAPFSRDVQPKTTPTPEQIQQEIFEITEPTETELEDEIDEIQESTVEEIVDEIAETLSKGKTKKQAKPNRLSSLFKKFKRE